MNTSFATAESNLANVGGLLSRVRSIAAAAAPHDVVALNAGAGTSDEVESMVSRAHSNITFDRVDVVDATVDHPAVRNTWRCSVESMPMVDDAAYDVVVANYLLEHVHDIAAALSEFNRVLRPGGCCILTVPNPIAPEFLVARFTPTVFHRRFYPNAFETHYSFRSIGALVEAARRSGLETTEIVYGPDVGVYLGRFIPRLAPLGRLYDQLALGLRIRSLLGHCLLSLRRVE